LQLYDGTKYAALKDAYHRDGRLLDPHEKCAERG
jgi:hypothetical protein